LKAAERSVNVVESEAQAEKQKILAEQASLQQELQAKESDRRVIASEVPADLLTTYERIAARRHGIGLAEVRDEACSLCGVRIRPHVFQELRRSEATEIFQCESCNRILYYVEPPVGAPPETEPKASAAGISANEA
jgi:predicted  nucleic acid-binding Zn-ribbon protein